MLLRIKYILLAFTTAIFLLMARLFYLQTYNHDELSKRLAEQKFLSAPINSLRGVIYDRNLIPLTDNGEKNLLVVIPQLINDEEKIVNLLVEIFGYNKEDIHKNIKANKPFAYVINSSHIMKVKERNLSGILITTVPARYNKDLAGSHILGYINSDNDGQFGIEKGMNNYLKRSGSLSIGVISDRFKNPITGWGYRAIKTFSAQKGANVRLTIDYHFQSIIEKQFDAKGYNGAAVLLDVKNGDILAMVSRPNFDPSNIEQYITSNNKELINKTLYPYNLGSIFKVVLVEAALESGIVKEDDIFNCTGYIEVDGQLKRCATHGGVQNVELNFSQAFAESCNTVFIQTGLKLGYNTIVNVARKFGFGQSVGLDEVGLTEDPGLLQYNRYVSNREVANLSIGQGSLLATPIQIANVMSIIANDGVKRDINLVDSIIDDNGNLIEVIRRDGATRVFSSEIIARVKKMMGDVTKVGTGSEANLDEYGGVAGKTSSAETGVYIGEEQIVHAWFGGFFPEDNPRYAMVVIVENGKSGAHTAAPLFKQIAYSILTSGY